VGELLSRASQAGLSWPLPVEWDDATLEDRLYTQHHQSQLEARHLPDFRTLHREPGNERTCAPALWEEGFREGAEEVPYWILPARATS
jgi:transposase